MAGVGLKSAIFKLGRAAIDVSKFATRASKLRPNSGVAASERLPANSRCADAKKERMPQKRALHAIARFPALQPVTPAGVQCFRDHLGRQAVHRRPGRPPVRAIRRKALGLDRPVILALERADDGGQGDAAAQRFGAQLVFVGQQHGQHGAA